jgi:hypothetical protein
MLEGRLEIGTKIYFVEEDNHAFSRKKIFMKDEKGVEWYRYDSPLRTHNMTEHTIVGRVLKDVEGRVPSMENHIDEYYLENGDQIDAGNIDEADSWSGYFLDKEQALQWLAYRKDEADRIERS